MNRLEFLKHILPSEGTYFVTGIKNGRPAQRALASIEEAVDWADTQVAQGVDAFFAMSAYKTPEGGRKKINFRIAKSIWVDLDIGEDTAYPTQTEGMQALRAFIKAVKLPTPTVVSSGYGLHVYWVFNEEIDYNTWLPLSKALLAKMDAEGFVIKDRGCTIDAARIFRIPETTNFKHGKQADVKLVFTAPAHPVQIYKDILKAEELSVIEKMELLGTGKANTLNETTKALLGNAVYNFARIVKRSVSGTGCAQIQYMVLNQDDTPEPLWRAGLSVAQVCVDRDTAVHRISCHHSEYDPAETDRKAAETKGPHLCSTFKTISPMLCDGCKHQGLISSPLLLGKDIQEAQASDNLVVAESPELGIVEVEIPDYPFPFFRGTHGGIYIRKPLEDGEDGETESTLVYENDFYVVGRRTDPDLGEVIHMRLIRPYDGISDFTAPLATLTASDKCRDMLSQRGVAANTAQMKGLMAYLVIWTKHMQNTSKAELVRVQFGWNDDNNAFVIGARELRKGMQLVYSPPSAATDTVVSMYSKMGTLEGWARVANAYALPGNEIRAFSLFLSLGAPMFKMFALGGAILHLTNASSGVGKSTIQMVANSVWGHPSQTMLTRDDTMMSKYHRMGVVQNMILCMDELTNLPPEDISNLAFGATNGRGKNRMQASANSERINNTTWSLPCITSGNNSLHEVLHSLKADPEGEIMRVMEMEVTRSDSMTKQESDQLFSRDMMVNFGHAGEIMMQYVLDNYDECVKDLYATQLEFDKASGFQQRERYYSALCATAIWGGKVANALGLVDIPVQPVIDMLLDKLSKLAKPTMTAADLSTTHLGLYMSENMQNQLIINQAPPAIAGTFSVPIETPRGALFIRRDPDTQRAYVIASALKTWCAKKQISYSCMLDDLRAAGSLLDIARVRMSAGTPQDSPAVMALVLDSSKL